MTAPAKIARSTGFYAIGSVSLVLFLFPLVWAAITSVKPREEAAASPPTGLPTSISLENYAKLAAYGEGIMTYIGNSVAVALMTVVFTAVVATLAGYGFSRFRFRGRNVLFLIILTALMIPFQTILISLFTVMKTIGLYNSLVGLALVYATFQLPFAIFLMRNSFDAIPRELEEAGYIDGAGPWRVLWSVMLPVVRPAVVTVALFAFLASWNEFFAALILIANPTRFTLPLALMNAQTGNFGTIDWGALQAGVTITVLPVVIVFLALQRFYVRGMIAGAVKA
jgi:multiple sugar transport system permease protein